MSVAVWPRRVGNRWPVAAAVAGALLAAVAVVGVQAAARSRVADARSTTTAYVEALEPLAMDAGRIVELGVKDGLQQLNTAPAKDASLARSARSWQRQLAAVQTRLEGLEEPRGADATGFATALDGYIKAAALIEEAAVAAPASRASLTAGITAAGRAADDQWDAAATALQAHATSLGLAPVAWLPG